ncbi:hypothetical protein [Peptococcus simiae]|uniref:hypothetical protein n=1 Tax=Peptococcus simiae TaxID=1643805 RepID=UPI003980EBDD
MRKKIITGALLLALTVTGCGSTSQSSSSTPPSDENLASSEIMAIDKNITTVDMTFPKDIIKERSDADIQSRIDQLVADGDIVSGKIGENTVTYKVTKKQHKEFVDEAVKIIEDTNQELIDDPNSFVQDVKTNSGYTRYNISVDATAYEEFEASITAITLWMATAWYRSVAGLEDTNIQVRYLDASTGEVLNELNSNDA